MLKNAQNPLLHIADVSDSSSSSDAPVKFLVRQTNGVMRGELTLDEETSKLYRNGTYDGQVNIRLELCAGASEHFKTDCYVSEVLNRS